jgi:Fe2+ or Zn2+ uptake regulation protein
VFIVEKPEDAAVPAEPSLRNSLHDRGQRLTPQRQRVLALFERIGEGSHLGAEEVHQRLLRSEERVSLATVYRTLRLLSSMGLLQELELPEGGRRFELASDDVNLAGKLKLNTIDNDAVTTNKTGVTAIAASAAIGADRGGWISRAPGSDGRAGARGPGPPPSLEGDIHPAGGHHGYVAAL